MQLASRKPSEVRPGRMGPLAKLPVFLDLAGKRAIVAGGTAAAAWKAELLAAAGAHVDVFAADVGDDMASLIEQGTACGELNFHPRLWRSTDFGSAAIALADAADEGEAQAFFEAAKIAGVPVNVIDRPAYCQFQFGSIVNRSPVIVGISTDGAAPILAQAVRRRIETLLPPGLADWGAHAKRIRAVVSARFAPGSERRSFWERFAERAFTTPFSDDAAVDSIAALSESTTDRGTGAGRVTLVGAGPGDAELLTLKAVRAMQAADVILFDDLVSDDVLELARREAKRMQVGKRGQRESCAQGDINALMIKLAQQGRNVVRLKSGDPMIFGRAGEEIAALERHGIRVEVVPGVTSALAAAARLGVSLTHRDCAQSVRFVTGHGRHGELPGSLDWHGLADPTTTLVFYMGRRTAPLIAGRLIAAGLAKSTPAVVVADATRPDEQRWRGDLATLAAGAAGTAPGASVLIGIGAAFAAARYEPAVGSVEQETVAERVG